jgi:TonB family protein
MSTSQAINAFDLLGQGNGAPPPAVQLPGPGEPQLEVGWGAFRQSFASSVSAALSRSKESRKFLTASFFKDAWVERKFPRRAVAAAALWHLVLIALPTPDISGPRHNSALDNTVLTWSGPVEDLPMLKTHGNQPKPTPRGEPEKPLPPKGADAFHPRQRIFTDPVHPTHPRQTLINPQAPPDAPKLLPNLPNMVEIAPSAMPARPKLEISERVLKSLRPHQKRAAKTDVAATAPEIQNNETHPADLSIAASQNMPARPQLELNTGSAPLAAKRKQDAESVATPEMALEASNGAASTLIALSATPGPSAPVEPPQGNLAARIAISPDGKQHGAPGGSPSTSASNGGRGGDHASSGGPGTGGGSGKSDIGVSISGGNPSSNVSSVGGAKPKLNLSAARPSAVPGRDAAAEAPPTRTAPPNFADLAPGAKPEAIFASKRVYTMHVNMPNLNSATGSWIINFSELRADPSAPRVAVGSDMVSPVAIKKVDPKYPPTLVAEHVEGEVVLYAVIRRDGSVDSIQLVKGVDEQLDENAMHAFAQWKFRPAEKQGEAVDLEAIVHIPFRTSVER